MNFLSTYKIKRPAFLILLFTAVAFASCQNFENKKRGNYDAGRGDLARIKHSGELKVVVDYNSTDYFIYRGQPMGFQYELLQLLSDDLGVSLEVVVSKSLGETFDGIKNGTYDLVAKNLTVTRKRRSEIDFTVPLLHTRQVIVQRKKTGTSKDSTYINSIPELAGKTFYVQKNTTFYRRLMDLSSEIGQPIEVVEDTVYGVEQLIAKVAKGEIDYTVSDENVAKLNQTYHPNLDVSFRISFPENIAWVLRKGSPRWKSYLDNWITTFKKTRQYRQLYHKYFESPRMAARLESEYHSIYGGKISEYDDLIKRLAEKYGWDWRLVSSIIFHESRFNPDAGSWAGAYGLMQLIPNTAEAFGIENYQDPAQNIKAGLLFLNWLNEQLQESVADSTERVKFILGAYNIGLGHVADAQRLAEKYGRSSQIWDDNVAYFLEKKSVEKYYSDPVVRSGYCRGENAVEYVERVMHNYEHYANLIPK